MRLPRIAAALAVALVGCATSSLRPAGQTASCRATDQIPDASASSTSTSCVEWRDLTPTEFAATEGWCADIETRSDGGPVSTDTTYSAGPCSAAGAIGVCVDVVGGHTTAHYYFEGFLSAEETCVRSGGEWTDL
jgi:hypothetical protein